MDIKNSKLIIKDIIGRYNFASLYFENGHSWENGLANFYGEPAAAIDFLLASAVTGNKVIGFFKHLPFFRIDYFLRGECVFVTENIPLKVKWTTVFCRKPENFSSKFALALKVSRESKLPVVLVVSQNAVNGFADFVKPDTDLVRTSPYIHPSTMETKIVERALTESFSTSEHILKTELPQQAFCEEGLSFTDSRLPFFDYLLPKRPTTSVLSLAGKQVAIPESETAFLTKFLKFNYNIDITVMSIQDENIFEGKEFLCPGCPFVNIFIKAPIENKMIFTDISCDGLYKAFNLTYATLDSYAGLLSKGLNMETVFIGVASSYKSYYKEFVKSGRMIFLNDCGTDSVSICSSIRHPKKFPKDKKNVLYPYSCFNIKKYSRPKVKAKKCHCCEKGEVCEPMEKTKCPALFVSQGKVEIDTNMCSGCYACKPVCKLGAIS